MATYTPTIPNYMDVDSPASEVKIVVDYETNPSHYPDGFTTEQMLELDLENITRNPYIIMDIEEGKWTTSGKVLSS